MQTAKVVKGLIQKTEGRRVEVTPDLRKVEVALDHQKVEVILDLRKVGVVLDLQNAAPVGGNADGALETETIQEVDIIDAPMVEAVVETEGEDQEEKRGLLDSTLNF